MALHRHHASARSDERCRQRACAGSQVKDKITGANTPSIDQLER